MSTITCHSPKTLLWVVLNCRYTADWIRQRPEEHQAQEACAGDMHKPSCCSPVFLHPPKIPTFPGLWDAGASGNHPITSFSTDLPVFSPKHPCRGHPRPPLTVVSAGTTGIISPITLKNNVWYNNFAEFTWWVFHFSISTVSPIPWVPVPPFLYKIHY